MRFLFCLFIMFAPSLNLFSQFDEEDERKSESFVKIDPEGKKGFMFGVNLGIHLPNHDPAAFYDGSPKGLGFLDINEFLRIDRIYNEVIQELGNASEFQLAEYASEMKYNSSITVGGHLRYQFNWYHSLVADVNFTSLKADDFFVLSYANDNGTSQAIFENFPIQGKEDRLMLSMGYQVALAEPGPASLHFELGPELTSLKVKSNSISIGSRTYSILRAETLSNGQLLNNKIPTLNYTGFYTQFGANIEFDKFTVDLEWRTSFQKIDLNTSVEAKWKMNHTPMARFVYRLSAKGF